jgi:hypothetical protein
MALMATWEITITCRDGSRPRFSALRGSAPQMGGIVEMADAGQTIKATIDACHKKPPMGVPPPFSRSWRAKSKSRREVSAAENGS